MNSTVKWHKRFLKEAGNIATWSKDPSTQCGCIIVDEKRRVVSTGYNGFPRGVEDTDERLNNRDIKYDLTIHAEMNALLFARGSVEGCTLYVSPLPPCIRCAVMIVQSGLSKVVAPKLPDHLESRWSESVKRSKEIFEEAGLTYYEY